MVAAGPRPTVPTRHHACDHVQGFYLGRPVAPGALLVQLRDPTPPSPTLILG
jgi:hypothetical protein